MRVRLLATLLLGLALTGGPALAGCEDTATTQADLNDCAAQSFEKSDTALNGLYRQIMQRLGKGSAEARQLVAAQRAWIAFRDAECDFAASGVEGGSIYPMTVVNCRDALTQKRIDDFKFYLACEEGDTACPVPAQ